MNQTNISIRIDKDLKQQFDKLCDELGFTMSTLLNVFIKKVVREQGIPFALSINDYNNEVRRAVENAEKGIGLSGPFNSVEDMMNDILKEDESV
ncbi:MAG: type II toxin-antitoxin system RelB/DinJ family antitoxin [Candidatus Gastranaerophilales bacterium]|nr:type II toxin-antitoxin system RelB/DinJ family antitoxin [Candidatus Gastranaerophilales bacterium]